MSSRMMKCRYLLGLFQRPFFLRLAAVLLTLTLCCSSLRARPVTSYEARKVVEGWLRVDARPLGAALGQQVTSAQTFLGDQGEPIYYVVYLQPSGFVIVPAEDLVEPIIGFCSKGTYNPSDNNPLGALVSRDMRCRIAATKDLRAITNNQPLIKFEASFETASVKAQNKWGKLLNYAEEETPEPITNSLNKDETTGDEPQEAAGGSQVIESSGLSTVSDIRVAPLVQSQWGQTTVGGYIGGISCYNYYTPPYSPGDPNNYPCGCGATAMAQLMRYHQYPTTGIGYPYLGGDGSGGPYNWSNMPLQPNSSITLTERQAIGALCYDAAESVDMSYGSGGSSSSLADASQQLTDTFYYTNSFYSYNPSIGTGLNNMINPNLDAEHPVLLGLEGPDGGHSIVCDGYGYSSSTLYHHLNMGWDGREDAWYNLPNVDSSPYDSNGINYCVYNVFTSGSGEIISGRVTDMSGIAINGATVTAQKSGGGTYNATTNTKGIYALAKVPSNSSYNITVTKAGYCFSPRTESTGTSADYASTSGNLWGIDFQATLIDIGLRVYDGTKIVKIACEQGGTSPLRIAKNGVIYGIVLVEPSDPAASKIRIKTSSGIKALRKF